MLFVYREEKDMLRVEITIFRDKSDPVHYLEHRAKDIASMLWKNDVDVTKVIFQEENREEENSCYIMERNRGENKI